MPAIPPANEAQIEEARIKYGSLTRAVEARATAKLWPRSAIPERWMLTLSESRDLVETASATLGIDTPHVVCHPAVRGARHDLAGHVIRRQTRALAASAVLHEVAHLAVGNSRHEADWWGAVIAGAHAYSSGWGRCLSAAAKFYRVDIDPWHK